MSSIDILRTRKKKKNKKNKKQNTKNKKQKKNTYFLTQATTIEKCTIGS